MDDPRKLRDIIGDQCEAKEITPADLAQKTETPQRYIEALLAGDTSRLPAFPYIRPHLVSIGETLGLPPELLTTKYKEEFGAMHSGSADKLPGNRFALPSYRRQYLIGIACVAVLMLAVFISRSGFFGQPVLTIEMPPISPSPYITAAPVLILAGHTDPGDSLFINGQHVPVGSGGIFTKEYQLLPELNVFEFSSKRFLGREIKITRQVYYDDTPTSTATTTTQ